MNFPGLSALVALDDWQFDGTIDGYGRTKNAAYNPTTQERRQWATPAEHLDCRCDICIVWRERYATSYHPDLEAL